jgi:hypothetical protein
VEYEGRVGSLFGAAGEVIMFDLKYNAVNTIYVELLSDADGVTALTGATPTVTLLKQGGADYAAIAGSVFEIGSSGTYAISFEPDDCDTLGLGKVKVSAAGAITQTYDVRVLPADVYEAIMVGSILLPVDVWLIAGRDQLSGVPLFEWFDQYVIDEIYGNGLPRIIAGTVTAATASSLTLSHSYALVDDQLVGFSIYVDRQIRQIVAYDAVNKVVTLDRDWSRVPNVGSEFIVIPGSYGLSPEQASVVAAVKAKTDNLPADPASETSLAALPASTAAAVWAAGTRTLTSFGTLAVDVATAVWGATTRTLTSLAGLIGYQSRVVSPVLSDYSIEIVSGDDYTGASALVLPRATWAGEDLTGATATFQVMPAADHSAGTGTWTAIGEAAVTPGPGVVDAVVELTGAESGGLNTSPPASRYHYVYQLVVTQDGREHTLWEGKLTVKL